MTRVLVADDQALIRGGIIMLLDPHPDIAVVGEAGDGAQAVSLAQSLHPDLVIMDLRMPVMDGVEATRLLTADGATPDADKLVKVLMLTTFSGDDSLYASLRAGASGFIVKDQAPKSLVPAVRAIAAGDSWIDPAVAGRVIRTLNQTAPVIGAAPELTARLTPREREVLILVARGLSNAEISTSFTLSEATVRTHVSRILMKTGSRDRSQAVALAYQSGLVRPAAGS